MFSENYRLRAVSLFFRKLREKRKTNALVSKSHLIVLAFLTLKKSSMTESKAEEPKKQGPLMDVFEKCCPPGLWCGKKRAITEENAAEEEEKDEKSSLEAFEKRCPPGL